MGSGAHGRRFRIVRAHVAMGLKPALARAAIRPRPMADSRAGAMALKPLVAFRLSAKVTLTVGWRQILITFKFIETLMLSHPEGRSTSIWSN